MERINGQREGFALVAALFGLVLIGAIVTGSFFAVSQEASSSRSSSAATDAFYVAEQGLAQVIGEWNLARVNKAVNATNLGTEPTPVPVPGGEYSVTVREPGENLYFVESTGRITKGGRYAGASRAVGVLAKASKFQPPSPTAMQVGKDTHVKGNATVSGDDLNPSNWDDCEDTGSHPGLVGKEGTKLTQQKDENVVGSPPRKNDPDLTDDDFTSFGDFDIKMLKAQATIRLQGTQAPKEIQPQVTEDGRCDTWGTSKKNESYQLTNWGAPLDPASPCHDYFPIIYREGNLHLNDGNGQGILLVEGNLELNGNLQFFGIVIVTGDLTKTNGTANINGMMIVHGQGDLGEQEVNGTPVIQYSSCAVKRAAEQNPLTGLVPVFARSWIDLSAAGVGM